MVHFVCKAGFDSCAICNVTIFVTYLFYTARRNMDIVDISNQCVDIEDVENYSIGSVIKTKKSNTYSLLSCGCCDRVELEDDYTGILTPDEIDIKDEDGAFIYTAEFEVVPELTLSDLADAKMVRPVAASTS